MTPTPAEFSAHEPRPIAGPRPRVHLVGADNVGWALDEELRLARLALDGIVALTDLARSEIVQATWWQVVAAFPAHRLAGRRVLSYVAQDVEAFLSTPRSIVARQRVGCWISRSRREAEILDRIGLRQFHVPYMVDLTVFHRLTESQADLRRRYGLPQDAYLIGSFQRDTEGSDLLTPKLVKGPDVFAATLQLLRSRGCDVHAVLAGPRRFWLRRRLDELGVPYSRVGRDVEGDDREVNTLPRAALNDLYNAIDLYLVSSRSEGGPQAILEAAAAGCRIVSTRVGIATDTLDAPSVVDSAVDAADRIEEDIRHDALAQPASAQHARVAGRHGPATVANQFRALYDAISDLPPFAPVGTRHVGHVPSASTWTRAWRRITRRRRPRFTLSLWHEFHRPPYGGGNQFMLALRKALGARGVRVVENASRADVHLLQSVWFDVDRLRRLFQQQRMPVLHRIDGPVQLIRGGDREKDELAFRLNAEYAVATVMQSGWCYARSVDLGYRPVNPIIIHNAVDPDLFNSRGRLAFSRQRRIRLIATSWSNNPRKGGATYRWLEQHLDWSRFEFTFVGRVSEPLKRARVIPPVGSDELGRILRDHDVYITASENDPCSNALIEALACGLPALYRRDGGHPEIVGFGGLPFNGVGDLLPQLEKLVAEYETFQSLISIATLDEVADQYLELMDQIRA